MKNTILTAIVLGLLSFSAKAQYFGIKGGLNFSNFHTTDNIDDQKMRTGYDVGAFVYLPITETFGVQPEVLYSTKGSTASYDTDLGILGSVNGDLTLKLNYIDIPLLAIFKVGKIGEIQLGPYFGFLANSSYEATGDFENSDDLDTDNFKTMDFGLAGGFALNLSLLQVGARYNYGLQKVEDSDASELLLEDSKNSYFQVFAALRFGDY